MTIHENSHATTLTAKRARRAQWFESARLGFFVHWGRASHPGASQDDPHTVYPYPDIRSLEAAAGPGLDVSQWVADAVAIGASYINLAAFHVGLGNLRFWRSDIPGSPTTTRDLLQELLDAADAAGIRVVVYVGGGPNARHPHFVEWLDAVAYRQHKGTDVDLHTHEGFVEFCFDVIDEMLTRYPRVAGLWFDGWNDDHETQDFFAAMHERHPHVAIMRNNFTAEPLPDEDVQSIEDFGKVFSPEWDYASGASVRSFGREFALKATMDWFYAHESHPHYDEYRPAHDNQPSPQVVVKRVLSILGSGWTPSLGFSPDVQGIFPPPVREVIEHLAGFWAWAAPALRDTVAAGHGRGGLPPGAWERGAYGVTTVSPGGERHWVHVLAAPSAGPLELADAGHRFSSVKLLRSGEHLAFTHRNGLLRVEVPDWSDVEAQGALTIELEADGPPRTVEDRVTSTTIDGKPADQLVSGHTSDAGITTVEGPFPHVVRIEFREPTDLLGLAIRQPDDRSVTGEGYAALPSERIRAFRVVVEQGDDAREASVGELCNHRGVQVINFTKAAVTALELRVESTFDEAATLRLVALTPIGAQSS